jgi:hypothetical protein
MRAATLWLPDRLEVLRAAAKGGSTTVEVARSLGLTYEQVRHAARYYDIPLARTRAVRAEPPEPEGAAALRARWAERLPELRAKLMRDLLLNDLVSLASRPAALEASRNQNQPS